MKKLHLLRHSIKDGPNGIIGPRGLKLARNQGQLVNLGHIEPVRTVGEGPESVRRERRYGRLFLGPQIENAQTALAFCGGLGYTPELMPMVYGLGDELQFGEIITREFVRAVAGGLSSFEAIRQVHGDQKALDWGNRDLMALIEMFSVLEDDEIGAGFFHGIPIELAAWACGAPEEDRAIWTGLKETEGLVFVCDSRSEEIPYTAGKICLKKSRAVN